MRVVHTHHELLRQFITRVSTHIDPGDWNVLVSELNKFIPGIDRVAMVDVITTCILQVTRVHSFDHDSLLRHRM